MKNEEYLVRATDGIKTHGTDRESGTLQETLICYRALVGDQGDSHMLELCNPLSPHITAVTSPVGLVGSNP